MFEAFTTACLTTMRETNAANWAENYDFPRVQSGEVVLSEVPHRRPSGITGLVMNTRHDVFADWRVREAMIQAFNFEFNQPDAQRRDRAAHHLLFLQLAVGMLPGPARGRVAEFLEPFAGDLLPGALEGYELPGLDGSERNRAGIAEALRLMEEAGYTVEEGVMTGPDGAPFTFDIPVCRAGRPRTRPSSTSTFWRRLERLGITPSVNSVDPAQYRERTDAFDFDMTTFRRGLSLSPGNEQRLYWGC